MTKTVHSGRMTLVNIETVWQLSDQGIVVTNGSDQKTIPYADISRVRLITFAGSSGTQARMTLKTSAFGKQKIGSHHYVSLGNFEDRSATFQPFVQALAKRVAAANTRAKFVTGSLGLSIAWGIVSLLVLMLVALIVIAATEGAAPWIKILSSIGLVIVLAPFSIRWVHRNIPKPFDPHNISNDLMGST